MKTIALHSFSQSKMLAYSALFAALCCLGTACVSIPMPVSGYFNIGDVFVLAAGWCLGPFFGAAAAGVGSALADVFLGYGIYAPATFFIKAMVAFIAYLVWAFLKKLLKNERLDILTRAGGALLGELCMVAGYYLFDSLLTGSFIAALATLTANGMQGMICAVCGTLLITAICRIKKINSVFPSLTNTQ